MRLLVHELASPTFLSLCKYNSDALANDLAKKIGNVRVLIHLSWLRNGCKTHKNRINYWYTHAPFSFFLNIEKNGIKLSGVSKPCVYMIFFLFKREKNTMNHRVGDYDADTLLHYMERVSHAVRVCVKKLHDTEATIAITTCCISLYIAI